MAFYIENPNVHLFVLEKYLEKAARNGIKEIEEISKSLICMQK